MSMTDPISDLLTRIRNGLRAKHRTVRIPASRIKADIVRILTETGYVESWRLEEAVPQSVLEVELKYDGTGQPAISGLERVSRPGRRVYRGNDEIPRVLDGLGVTIVSTPSGVMTGSQCQRQRVGGEVLCNIW